MLKEKENKNFVQTELNDLLKKIGDIDKSISSGEIEAAINRLRQAKRLAEKREEAERRRAQKEEQERRKIEEQEKRQAHINEVTCMELPLDWDNVFDSDGRTQGVHTDSISDALVLCLSELGRVDIEYISAITGADYKTVIGALKGSIYQNPETWNECFYRGWETSDEYLSGNLMRKLKAARTANEQYDGYFSDNISAIEKVMPPAVATEDIYITLGSPWVPPDIIDDFILHLFGKPPCSYRYSVSDLNTIHDEITGTWEIPNKSRYIGSVGVSQTYGTNRMEALHIIEKTLNMKTVAVTDKVSCPANASGSKRVINKEETIAAVEKQQLLIKEFQQWVWLDGNRKKRLEKIFEENYGCVSRRIFDGSFLKFPGMSPSVELYPYQKDAVARIIFTPNTLLAHDVGAGKTYVMIAAGQELRRMELSKKNMYVVPNNIVGQWRDTFSIMYPNAKLLCIEPKSFTPQKREAVLERIRGEDFDGIIIAYSCFEQIPLSKDYYIDELNERIKLVSDAAEHKSKATSRLKEKKKSLEKALAETILVLDDMYDTVYFDELGINRLFVDEAHNFKNVPIDTKANMVLGINSGGSKKCKDMMDKVHLVQKKNDGRGVVMATGTPITNSITDAYIMQQYLQSGELAMLNLQSFDSWIGMFAERSTEFEIDVDTSTYRLATRFAKFHNLPELTALLSSIADFHGTESIANIPCTDGYNDALISKTAAFSSFLADISYRADAVRSRSVSRKDDNMLKITADGRKAALDMRLVDKAYLAFKNKTFV